MAALGSWLLLSLPAGASPSSGGIEFLYIDANVGGSSGGHMAVRLGDMVYHFQNDQGHTRLARESWKRFRFIYNDVDNRNIRSARVKVSVRDGEKVRDRLSLLFQVQNRHLDFLLALQDDVRLLEALRSGIPVGMPGTGFFQRGATGPEAFGHLRREITLAWGSGSLSNRRRRLLRQIEAMRYAPAQAELNPSVDRYPTYPPTFSERTRDLYACWFALAAIEEGWPLRDTALVEASGLSDRTDLGARLESGEREWLRRYRNQMQETVLSLLAAPYPGSGAALLLALARYQAITVSLDAGRLFVLNVLPVPKHATSPELPEGEAPALQRLIRQLRLIIPDLRHALFSRPDMDEAGYHRLEVAASELREAEGGLQYQRAVRFSHHDGPPEGLGYVVLPSSVSARTGWDSDRAVAQARADEFTKQYNEIYGYQLITRNCVTELAKAVNSSFPANDERVAFGGHLEPGADQGFIPFRYFELVRQHYRIDRITTLTSYRNRKLDELSRDGEDWRVMLREGNTLTSSVYSYRSGDTAFLFFTERFFWPRPLLGAFNLGYALTVSAAGIFNAPFDGGNLLWEGLKGGVFSLPELALWNIRKGSFDEMIPQAGGMAPSGYIRTRTHSFPESRSKPGKLQ